MNICHIIIFMFVIGRKIILEAQHKFPQIRTSLNSWEKMMRTSSFRTFWELKATFPSVDYVHHIYTIFNVSGNKYRLISRMDYLAQVIEVKSIWTHSEYSENKSQKILKGGLL